MTNTTLLPSRVHAALPCAGSFTARDRPKASPGHGSSTSTPSSCIWQHIEQPRPPPYAAPSAIWMPTLMGWGDPGLDLREHMRRPSSRVRTSDQPDISRPASSVLYGRDASWGPFSFGIFLPVYQTSHDGLRSSIFPSLLSSFPFSSHFLGSFVSFGRFPGFQRSLVCGLSSKQPPALTKDNTCDTSYSLLRLDPGLVPIS